jgi:ABC-type multidrug transport system fused ATPase/permease subunit
VLSLRSGLLRLMILLLASVDYATDRKIQDTIATEFADRTILCIARKFFFSLNI